MLDKLVKICVSIAYIVMSVWLTVLSLDCLNDTETMKKWKEKRKERKHKYSTVEETEDED